MTTLRASYSKGQVKIQQMAFVLVAIFIFFAMVAVFYISVRTAGIKEDAQAIKEEQIKEQVIKLAGTPEFAWKIGKTGREDCTNCIDLDKVFVLRDMKEYNKMWDLDYLAVMVYPIDEEVECTRANYPNCNKITVIENKVTGAVAPPKDAFVAVCRLISTGDGSYRKCEIGKIYAAGAIG